MAPRSRLAQYVFDRISERGETPEEFAVRNGINPSGLYKFLRGAYAEPRQTTLDKIASGLNLTPAELLVATGKGAIEDDPEDAELLALIRRLPEEHRPTVKTILRELSRRREHHVDHAEPSVTDVVRPLVRSNSSLVQPVPSVKRRYEPQSVAAQIVKYGLQPATV